MKNKKGQEINLSFIVVAAIAAISALILVLLIAFASEGLGKFLGFEEEGDTYCDEDTCTIPLEERTYREYYYNQVHLTNYLLKKLGINATEQYSGEIFYELDGEPYLIWCKQVTDNYNEGLLGCCKFGRINTTTKKFIDYEYNSCDNPTFFVINESR